MADDDVTRGYRDIPEEDRKKANAFFEQGRQLVERAQYDYSITLYLNGLEKDPENVDAHQALREVSLKRKVSGGKPLGMKETWALKTNTSDDKANLLAAEKLLAYDPGNLEWIAAAIRHADAAGLMATKQWFFEIYSAAGQSR